jgi:hypothetical protein
MISNVLEQEDILTAAQVSDVQHMTEQQFSEQKEPNVGGLTTTGMNPLSVLNAIGKALFFDYNFFYDIDYTTTEVACEAGGGTWQTSTTPDSCKTPNEWMVVRYIFFIPITISMLFFIGLTIWHAIRG